MNLPSEAKEDPPDSISAPYKSDFSESGSQLIRSLWPDITPAKWRDWKWQMSHRLKSIEPLSLILGLKQQELHAYMRLIAVFN